MTMAYLAGQLNNLRNDYNRQVDTFREKDRKQQELIEEQAHKIRELEGRTRTAIKELNAKLLSKADKTIDTKSPKQKEDAA